MHKIWLSVAFLVSALNLIPFDAAPAKAQVKPVPLATRLTVTDYFLRLPETYFNVDRAKLLKRAVVDTNHDFLSFKGGDSQPSMQLAIFRHHGEALIAVSCEYGLDHAIDLLRYEPGKWVDVTKMFHLTVVENEHFVLPQYGTTIKIYHNKGQFWTSLYWRNGSFILDKSRL